MAHAGSMGHGPCHMGSRLSASCCSMAHCAFNASLAFGHVRAVCSPLRADNYFLALYHKVYTIKFMVTITLAGRSSVHLLRFLALTVVPIKSGHITLFLPGQKSEKYTRPETSKIIEPKSTSCQSRSRSTETYDRNVSCFFPIFGVCP